MGLVISLCVRKNRGEVSRYTRVLTGVKAMNSHVVIGTADPETPDEWASCLAVMPVADDTAAILRSLRAEDLSPRGWVDALRANERHMSALQAQRMELLAALEAGAGRPVGVRTTQEEVACALRLPNAKAGRQLAEAERLVRLFPSTVHLLGTGEITYEQARAVTDVTVNCGDEQAQAVEALVSPMMPHQNNAATRRALQRAVICVDPAGRKQRHARAMEGRHVTHSDAGDGMAWWGAKIASHDAARMDASLDAHAAKVHGDDRTLAQRRADALVGLITGDVAHLDTSPTTAAPTPGRSGPVVQVTVSYDTLIGANDDPADLKGYGPITAGQARALATEPGSVWRRLLIEPKTGLLIKTDPNTYRPTAEVARHVIARDRTCAFPTCHMPAHRSDLDHITPFGLQGGTTTPDNLIPLCRRHHRAKHRARWTPQRDRDTGAVHWTSPTGHRYTKQPHSYRP